MANSKQPPAPFAITVTEEGSLIRFGLTGEATLRDASALRAARLRFESSTLPVLVVDDGLSYIDTVIYGTLAQWAGATRNRNVGWTMASSGDGAGRMFQMAGLNPGETVYPSEDLARQALDRGKSGQRVVVPNQQAMALEGLRPK